MERPTRNTDYWGSDPDYPVAVWEDEVADGATRQGYWDWVVSRMAGSTSEPEPGG